MIVGAQIMVEVDGLDPPPVISVGTDGTVEVDLAGDDRITLRFASVYVWWAWATALADEATAARAIARRPPRLEDEATEPPMVYGAGVGAAEDLEGRVDALARSRAPEGPESRPEGS